MWRKLHPKFSCFSVRVQTCFTGLPARLPIKEILGEPGLQPAASHGLCHTHREHNLNYTIWTLYAESVSFSINATLLWGAPTPIYQATWCVPTPIYQETWGAPNPIYQTTWGMPTPICQALWGAPTPIYQTTWGVPSPIYQATWGTPSPICQATRGVPSPTNQTQNLE
jgi:hypothetical protein